MDIRDEIVARVDQLPPEMQQQVLRFVASLSTSLPRGESGTVLTSFAGLLDPQSAREMVEAIEEECERINASEW
jgi:hypothetical protein